MRRIVVIGGAFNPPTVAHIRLAELAREAVEGDRVLFIPARKTFLTGWKGLDAEENFTEGERVEMLRLAISEHPAMGLDACEIDGHVSGKTVDTLPYLKGKYGADEMYLAFGSDKLGELYSWYQADRLLADNRFIVMRRNYEPVMEKIKEDPFLEKYRDRFILCGIDASIEEISSTQIRKAIKNGTLKDVRPYLCEEVYHFIQKRLQKKARNPEQ